MYSCQHRVLKVANFFFLFFFSIRYIPLFFLETYNLSTSTINKLTMLQFEPFNTRINLFFRSFSSLPFPSSSFHRAKIEIQTNEKRNSSRGRTQRIISIGNINSTILIIYTRRLISLFDNVRQQHGHLPIINK